MSDEKKNTGYSNTGYRNTGNRNTGDWNTGDWNTGYCNTGEPTVRMFNKDTGLKFGEINFPNFFFFDLTEWVCETDMSEEEKEACPSYATTGGYLKCKSYRQAWRESWDKTSKEDKEKTLKLPNWNNELFKEISGIDVEKELGKKQLTNDELVAELERRGIVKSGKIIV